MDEQFEREIKNNLADIDANLYGYSDVASENQVRAIGELLQSMILVHLEIARSMTKLAECMTKLAECRDKLVEFMEVAKTKMDSEELDVEDLTDYDQATVDDST